MERVTGSLDSMLAELAAVTAADCVMTGELVDGAPDMVRVRRMWLDGSWSEETRYPLTGTPCEDVFSCRSTVVPAEVAARFPEDPMLAELAMQAYVGVPLPAGQAGRVQGILVALFRRPLQPPEGPARVLAALEARLPRVGFELERLQYEERLAASERRYRSLVEQSSDGIIVHRDFFWLYANPAAAELFGYDSPQALIATGSVLDLLPSGEQARLLQLAEAYWSGADVPREHDLTAQHRDGHALALHVSISEVDWDGEVAYQVVLNDVTARREAEGREQQARRLEAIGQLTGGIAHDFNNLLAIILGNLELLEEYVAHSGGRQLLADAVLAAEQGADLTRRLLSFARRQALEPRRIRVLELFQQVEALLKRTLSAEIALQIEDHSDAWIRVDPTQLQAALLNLAINARDAMQGPGQLAIRAWCPQQKVSADQPEPPSAGWVCLEVADNGCGMTPAVLERAFEPFFSTRSDAQGSGLGLSMVHGFVRQSAGHVELDSKPGAGTRVRILLPRDDTQADEVEGTAAPSDASSLMPSGQRVLVVEDDAAVRRVAVEMLRSFGLQVAAAADGTQARALLQAEHFDLMLTDVILPGGPRGPDLAAFARQLDPALPVVFMTGYADVETFERFAGLDDCPVLQKPFRRQDLRRQMEVALGRGLAR